MTAEQMNDMTIEQENSQKEKSRRLDAFYWAGALIWVGLVFWADSQDVLPQIGDSSAWTWIFLGGGAAGLLLNFYSYSSPAYANPTTGRLHLVRLTAPPRPRRSDHLLIFPGP